MEGVILGKHVYSEVIGKRPRVRPRKSWTDNPIMNAMYVKYNFVCLVFPFLLNSQH